MTSTRLRVGGRVRHKPSKSWATVARLTHKTTEGLFGPISEVTIVHLVFEGSNRMYACHIAAFNRNYLAL